MTLEDDTLPDMVPVPDDQLGDTANEVVPEIPSEGDPVKIFEEDVPVEGIDP